MAVRRSGVPPFRWTGVNSRRPTAPAARRRTHTRPTPTSRHTPSRATPARRRTARCHTTPTTTSPAPTRRSTTRRVRARVRARRACSPRRATARPPGWAPRCPAGSSWRRRAPTSRGARGRSHTTRQATRRRSARPGGWKPRSRLVRCSDLWCPSNKLVKTWHDEPTEITPAEANHVQEQTGRAPTS